MKTTMGKRALVVLATTAAILASAPAYAQTSWQDLGGSATDGGVSNSAAISSGSSVVEMDSSGFPVIAWTESVSVMSPKIYLKRWSGNGWTEAGGSASGEGVSKNTGYSVYPALAVDPSKSDYYVAWNGYGTVAGISGRCVFLRKWKAATSEWEGLAGSDSGGGVSGLINSTDTAIMPISVALDAQGRPWVAYAAAKVLYDPTEVRVKGWNGTAWIELAGSAGGGGISNTPSDYSYYPSLRVDVQGRPVVAWVEETNEVEIYVKQWNGSAWVELAGSASGGGISQSTDHSYAPSLALDGSDHPLVAWIEYGSDTTIFLKAWDPQAGTWKEMGTSASGPGIATMGTYQHPMALRTNAAGVPAVAFPTEANEIRVRRWDGSAWPFVGPSDFVDGTGAGSDEPCLAMGKRGLGVTWTQPVNGSNEIFYREFDDVVTPEFESLAQLRGDGSPAATGAVLIGQTGFTVQGSYKASFGGTVRMDVEVRPLGTAFTGQVTGSDPGATNRRSSSVTIPGLSSQLAYHWQGRLTDEDGLTSGWISFGGNAESEADFRTEPNFAPGDPSPTQLNAASGSPIAAGASLFDREGVMFRTTANDPNGRRVRFEVELRPAGVPFSDHATVVGPFVASGAFADATVELGQGSYHWQGRVADEDGGTSGWARFGGNAGTSADFVLVPFGSQGTFCGGSASGASTGSLAWAVILGAFAALRRRS